MRRSDRRGQLQYAGQAEGLDVGHNVFLPEELRVVGFAKAKPFLTNGSKRVGGVVEEILQQCAQIQVTFDG